MEIVMLVVALWLVLGTASALILGRMTRGADMAGGSLTDDELDACKIAYDAHQPDEPVQVISLTDKHRLIVDWKQRTMVRVHNGRRVELLWPYSLASYGG